jgi:hypothetical protein
MRASFVQFVRVRMLLAALAAVLMVLGGNTLLRVWLRRGDVSFSPAVWATLAALLLATCWVSAHGDLLTIMDRLWVNVALVLVNGAVTVGLTWALAPSLKVLGALIATGFVTATLYTWIVPSLASALIFRPHERSRGAS